MDIFLLFNSDIILFQDILNDFIKKQIYTHI